MSERDEKIEAARALRDRMDRGHRMTCSDPGDPTRRTYYSDARDAINDLLGIIETLTAESDEWLTHFVAKAAWQMERDRANHAQNLARSYRRALVRPLSEEEYDEIHFAKARKRGLAVTAMMRTRMVEASAESTAAGDAALSAGTRAFAEEIDSRALMAGTTEMVGRALASAYEEIRDCDDIPIDVRRLLGDAAHALLIGNRNTKVRTTDG